MIITRSCVSLLLLLLLLVVVVPQVGGTLDDDDDEFGIFDDDDEDEETAPSNADDPFSAYHDNTDDQDHLYEHEDDSLPPSPKKSEPKEPKPVDIPSALLGICLLLVVIYSMYQWYVGSQENEAVARMYAATVFEYLMEHFVYVGFGKPKGQDEQCEDPILSKDGARWFYLHATGMKNVKYCTITLQLRSRHNLFKKMWEAYAGKKADRATVEIVLRDKSSTTPFVAGIAKGSSSCEEMKDIGTDLEQFVVQPKASGATDVFQDTSAGLCDWKKHLKHPLNVLCDSHEVLRPSNGLFTSQVLGVISHLATEDIFEYLHISSELVEIHETRWRDTQAYQTEKTKKHQTANDITSLDEGTLGVRLSFNLPEDPEVGEQYQATNAVLLPLHLAVYLAQKLASFSLGQQAHQRQVKKHNEPLLTLLKELRDKRAAEQEKNKQRAELAEEKQRKKESIASVTRPGPPKPREVYG